MSRALPEGKREKDDLYITPPACVAPLLDELAPFLPSRPYVLDPGAGSGSISQAVLDAFPGAYLDAAELREEHADELAVVQDAGVYNPGTQAIYRTKIHRIHWGDFLTTTPEWEWERVMSDDGRFSGPDLVVGNPPYRYAREFITRSREISDGWVAMLLRVGFLESQVRYPFWVDNAPTALRFLVERPQFIPGRKGSDSAAYAWFLWADPRVLPADFPPFGWYRWHDQA